MAHPVVGLATLEWTPNQRHVEIDFTPPSQLNREEVLSTPFGHITLTEQNKISARLTDPDEVKRFALFANLSKQGVTHYLGFGRSFTPPGSPLPFSPAELKGAVIAFCTNRMAGFSGSEMEGLERLIPAMCVCVRVAIDRILVAELLDRYLGPISGSRVLSGQTTRGDGSEIECALLYSDMRDSAEFSRTRSMQEYLGILNSYFDCTAGAVIDHGGEVLKFIGDGVLAIFPFEEKHRPPESMCRAALSATKEAFARLEERNRASSITDGTKLSFGVALTVGKVVYGNVGTEKRLDFTATGPSVALASRCEELTKTLDAGIIATADFVALCDADATPLGQHKIRGFAAPVQLFSYAC
jgi:adenylate cyclase